MRVIRGNEAFSHVKLYQVAQSMREHRLTFTLR